MTHQVRDTIFIYNDEGVSQDGVVHLKKTLSEVFTCSYRISLISARELIENDWERKAVLIAIGGGRDSAYHALLQGVGNQKIRRFVKNGGLYVGICAGAYYASSSFVFAEPRICATRQLRFFKGQSVGPHIGSFGTATACKTFVKEGDRVLRLFYHAGGCFQDAQEQKNVTVHAWYDQMHQFPSVIECKVGKGRALISGVHFEYDPELMHDLDLKLIAKLKNDNAARLDWIKSVVSDKTSFKVECIMTEYVIGEAKVPAEILKTRLEALSSVQHGRHWVKKDLCVQEFSWASNIVWKISKFLPVLRSFLGAAKPQEIASILEAIKPQVADNPELTTIFNRAVRACNDLTHQNITFLESVTLENPALYDPEETKTVSGLFDMHAFMKEQYKGRADMQKQGEALSQKYFFQNCRGGGNCFYLGYISGWLHHLVKNPGGFQEAIRHLLEHPNSCTEKVVLILRDLETSPTLENLYTHLRDEKQMDDFIQCLRFIARDGILTIDDGKGGLQYDDDQIAAVIFDNPDFSEIEKAERKQVAFAERQSRMGENIQTPEVSVLHRWICPVSICFSQDHRESTLRGKFAEGYNEGHPIALFQRNNHFDALIAK